MNPKFNKMLYQATEFADALMDEAGAHETDDFPSKSDRKLNEAISLSEEYNAAAGSEDPAVVFFNLASMLVRAGFVRGREATLRSEKHHFMTDPVYPDLDPDGAAEFYDTKAREADRLIKSVEDQYYFNRVSVLGDVTDGSLVYRRGSWARPCELRVPRDET